MGKKGGGKPPHAAGGAPVAGGVSKPASSKGKLSGGAKTGPSATNAKDAGDGGDFDLDALFSKGKAAKAKVDAAAAAAEAARLEEEGPKEKDRVLLPGQKKKKQKREAPEFVPVNEPRRFEEGLPVFKSYGDFSDVSCGQAPPKDPLQTPAHRNAWRFLANTIPHHRAYRFPERRGRHPAGYPASGLRTAPRA